MKTCIKCNNNKDIIHFSTRKGSKDGYRNSCRTCDNIIKNKWKKDNHEFIIKSRRLYKKRKNELYRKRKSSDNLFKCKESIRLLILINLRKKEVIKNSKTIDILGCDYDFFKSYLESKFEPWMTWENHGKHNSEFQFGWDLDHIIPISSAKNEMDVINLNHFTNFQPLCSKINRDIKNNKINFNNE